MARKQPITIAGQPIGKFKASWLLFKESAKFLRSDSEMILLPFITGLLNLFVYGVLVVILFFVVLGGKYSFSGEDEVSNTMELMFIFATYVIGAFTLALSQAGIAHTVHTRALGGNATLVESLKAAFSRSGQLFVWSLITSTVGIILRMIAERSKIVGRIVVMILGVGWSVMTYFVVPAMMIDKLSATNSIKRSSQVFRSTWGETIVSNFSLGITFFLIYLVSILSLIGLFIVTTSGVLLLVVIGAFVLWFIFLALVQSAMEGVLKTLLYIYASEGVVPPNFNQELLQKMISQNKIPTQEQDQEKSADPFQPKSIHD